MCIELKRAVKHLKGSEVAPRCLFQGFLQIRSKKTIQHLQSDEDYHTATHNPPLNQTRGRLDSMCFEAPGARETFSSPLLTP